jgi:hypothetical protein
MEPKGSKATGTFLSGVLTGVVATLAAIALLMAVGSILSAKAAVKEAIKDHMIASYRMNCYDVDSSGVYHSLPDPTSRTNIDICKLPLENTLKRWRRTWGDLEKETNGKPEVGGADWYRAMYGQRAIRMYYVDREDRFQELKELVNYWKIPVDPSLLAPLPQ